MGGWMDGWMVGWMDGSKPLMNFNFNKNPHKGDGNHTNLKGQYHSFDQGVQKQPRPS